MTPEEAMERIIENDCGFYCGAKYPECDMQDCRWYVALRALEKQIPKKPINWANTKFICPSCHRAEYIVQSDALDTYCGFCGQAIDWGEEK